VSLPVAILAGGLATRLHPVTTTIPKALVDVAGRPFAEHQLDWLRAQSVERVVFCVAHLGEMIRDALGDGSRWQLRIDYVFDGGTLLGTAGALKRALPVLGDAFFVLYGDSFLTCELSPIERAFRASGRAGLMTVFRNDDKWDRSNVQFRDGELVRYDKVNRTPDMRHIDYGLGVLTARALAWVPPDRPSDLAAVYQRLLADGDLAGVEVSERFYEIGSPEGLEETRLFLSNQKPKTENQKPKMTYTQQHLREAAGILDQLDAGAIERLVDALAAIRGRGGRLFFLGVGGSAGNCSHAVNDFRKLAGFEAYAPTDNVSELTARTNDEGWDTVFAAWLAGSRLRKDDGVFVMSVGGGSLEKNVSVNLVRALEYASSVGATIVGIVGRDGGHTARVADACVVVPTVNPETITPHTEAFQAVLWHLLVSHPKLKTSPTKWESTR
jgi:D-sedoheptulose 7-phosphate isomerase